jgi:hypothetical protein
MKTMNRERAAKLVTVLGVVAMLGVAWQAVRFAIGDIGNPISPVYKFIALTLHETGELPSVITSSPFSTESLTIYWPLSFMIWCIGFSVWLVAATIVGHIGQVAARVVLVGWRQYRAEQREDYEAARIAAERQAAKERRRDLRRQVLEAREPRRKSSGILPFVLGTLFGSFFL